MFGGDWRSRKELRRRRFSRPPAPEVLMSEFRRQPKLHLSEFRQQPELHLSEFRRQPELHLSEFRQQPELLLSGVRQQPELLMSEFRRQPKLLLSEVRQQPELLLSVFWRLVELHLPEFRRQPEFLLSEFRRLVELWLRGAGALNQRKSKYLGWPSSGTDDDVVESDDSGAGLDCWGVSGAGDDLEFESYFSADFSPIVRRLERSSSGDVLEFKLDILKALSELRRQEEVLLSELRQVRLLLSDQLPQDRLLLLDQLRQERLQQEKLSQDRLRQEKLWRDGFRKDELQLQEGFRKDELQRQEGFRKDELQRQEEHRKKSYLSQVVLGVGLAVGQFGIQSITSPPSRVDHFKRPAVVAVYYAAQVAEIILGVVLVFISKQCFHAAGASQLPLWHQIGMMFIILSLILIFLTVLLVRFAK